MYAITKFKCLSLRNWCRLHTKYSRLDDFICRNTCRKNWAITTPDGGFKGVTERRSDEIRDRRKASRLNSIYDASQADPSSRCLQSFIISHECEWANTRGIQKYSPYEKRQNEAKRTKIESELEFCKLQQDVLSVHQDASASEELQHK